MQKTGVLVTDLQAQFGDIDIYLFDQVLKGRIASGMIVLDAGCGIGRNLVYFLQQGYQLFGVDRDAASVGEVRTLAAQLAPQLARENFRAETLEGMSFPNTFVDVVISSAVLHFAEDDRHFRDMLHATWRVLRPGGLLFCRLATSIGMERQLVRISGRRFLLPDGSERYLADETLLMRATRELGGELVDPLKTTVVQNQRSMTTWVVRRSLLSPRTL